MKVVNGKHGKDDRARITGSELGDQQEPNPDAGLRSLDHCMLNLSDRYCIVGGFLRTTPSFHLRYFERELSFRPIA